MRVLVIIPVYNRHNLVIQALESVKNQSYPATRVVVVDDGSTDSTAETIQEWFDENKLFPGVLIKTPNQGAASARNIAIDRYIAGSDAVAFLDSDDLWPIDFLQRSISILDEDPEVVAVSSDRCLFDVASNARIVHTSRLLAEQPLLFMLEYGAGIGSCTVLRSIAVEKTQRFPADVLTGHDAIFFSRIAKLGLWQYNAGDAVIFRRNFSKLWPTEADHLHRQFNDYQTKWAFVSETIYLESNTVLSHRFRARKLLWHRWKIAFGDSVTNGRREDAITCLKKLFKTRPFKLLSLFMLSLNLLGNIGVK
jgi:glycosyltransferase involved in cell wall biosynthesis